MVNVEFRPLLRPRDVLESPTSRIEVMSIDMAVHTYKNEMGELVHDQETRIGAYQRFKVKKPTIENGIETGEFKEETLKEYSGNMLVTQDFINAFTLTPSEYSWETIVRGEGNNRREFFKFYNYGYTFDEDSVKPDDLILAHGMSNTGDIVAYLGKVTTITQIFRNVPPSHLEFKQDSDEVYVRLKGICYSPFSTSETESFVIKSGEISTSRLEDIWILRPNSNIGEYVLNYEGLIEHKYFPLNYIDQSGIKRAGITPAYDLLDTLQDLRKIALNENRLTVKELQNS